MLIFARHLAAVLLLPFVVTVLVPRWALNAWATSDTRWISGSLGESAARIGAMILFAGGIALFVWCIALFARVGQGTLAPWDPTQRLIAVGPYRHSRNPMITSVLAILAAEALFLGSRVLAIWCALFASFNHLYFLLSEEPGLRLRFGESYDEYKRAVPRWLPRFTPWRGSGA